METRLSRQHQLEAAIDESSAPAIIDLDWLRQICAQGPLPDFPPLLRQRIWRLLLGVLPPEKRSWTEFTQANHRRYYTIARRLVDDLPSGPLESSKLVPKDQLLDSIAKDVSRMQTFIAQIDPPTPRTASPSDEHSPSSEELPPIGAFETLAERVRTIKHGPHAHAVVPTAPPQIMVFGDEEDAAPTPPEHPTQPDEPRPSFDVAASLIRILYFHANLHPDRLYNQAWPALLSPIYYIVASSGAETGDPHQAEADAFWTFGELLGDVDPVLGIIDADGTDRGVQKLLVNLSQRVRWADEEFWDVLRRKSLDPALPYWSFRWISCMVAQTLPLHQTIYIWDLLLAQPPAQSSNDETPRLTFLVDICASMLLRLRPRLIVAGNKYKGGLWGDVETEDDQALTDGTMGDGFVEGMKIIQSYPIEAVGVPSIIQGAWYLVDREKRERQAAEEQARRAVAAANSSYSLARVTGSLKGFGWGGGGVTKSLSSKGSDPAGPLSSPDATPRTEERPASKSLRYGYFDVGDAAAKLSKARSNLTAAAIAWSAPRETSPTTSKFDVRSWVSAGSSTPRSSFSGDGDGSSTLSSRHARTESASTDVSLHPPTSPPVFDRSTLPMLAQPTMRPAPPVSPSPRGSDHSRAASLGPSSPFLRPRSPSLLGGDRTPAPPLPSPTPSARGGVRPLILSNRRVTRDSTVALSRQSSISSRASDTENTPSRIVPLRRRRVLASPAPSSPPSSSASSLKSPPSRFDQHPLVPEDLSPELERRNTIIAAASPSPSTTNPGPPTPADSPERDMAWHDNGHSGLLKRGETMPAGQEYADDRHLALHASPSLQRQSRLRAKRSLPLLDSIATKAMTMPLPTPTSSFPDHNDMDYESNTDDATKINNTLFMHPPPANERAGVSPLTPRPPVGQIPDSNINNSNGSIVRRPSPKPRRTRKVSHRKEEKPQLAYMQQPVTHAAVPKQQAQQQADIAYMQSEEEGVKGDDEDDYNDLLSAYSTDADPV